MPCTDREFKSYQDYIIGNSDELEEKASLVKQLKDESSKHADKEAT
jgi:hypothetical protein